MVVQHQDETGKLYVYSESFWTAKRELSVDGVAATELDKKVFKLPDKTIVTISGSILAGAKLVAKDGKETILCQNKWYEWLLIFLPLASIGVGVFGGAIGGFLSAVAATLAALFNVTILRSKANIVIKVFVCLVLSVAAFFAWFLIYSIIAGGISAAISELFAF